jgi:hypothetical protein
MPGDGCEGVSEGRQDRGLTVRFRELESRDIVPPSSLYERRIVARAQAFTIQPPYIAMRSHPLLSLACRLRAARPGCVRRTIHWHALRCCAGSDPRDRWAESCNRESTKCMEMSYNSDASKAWRLFQRASNERAVRSNSYSERCIGDDRRRGRSFIIRNDHRLCVRCHFDLQRRFSGNIGFRRRSR